MEYLKRILEDFGLSLPLLIAGAVGGFIHSTQKEDLSFVEKFTIILVGAFIANYIGPMVANFLSIKQTYEVGFSFILGFIGIEVLQILSRKVKNWVKKYNGQDNSTKNS